MYDYVPEHKPKYNINDAVGVEVAAKKPARGCPCSWVCIGLVLVGVVACVSMAVAVWSTVEVHMQHQQQL